jgi:hypothetical protein
LSLPGARDLCLVTVTLILINREKNMKIFKHLAFAGAMMAGSVATAQEQFITIGTGGQTGVYFVVGQSICRLVNRGTADHNL